MKKHSSKALLIIICFFWLPGFQCELARRVLKSELEASRVQGQYFCGAIFDGFSETEPCTDQKCHERYCHDTTYNNQALCLSSNEIIGSEGIPNNRQTDMRTDDQEEHDGDSGGGNIPVTTTSAVFPRPSAQVKGLLQDSHHHNGDGNENNSKLHPYDHKICCCMDYDDDDDDQSYHTAQGDDQVDDNSK